MAKKEKIIPILATGGILGIIGYMTKQDKKSPYDEAFKRDRAPSLIIPIGIIGGLALMGTYFGKDK